MENIQSLMLRSLLNLAQEIHTHEQDIIITTKKENTVKKKKRKNENCKLHRD